MRKTRIALLVASGAVVLLLAGGGLALRVGAAEGAYGDSRLFSKVLGLILDHYVDPVDPAPLIEEAYEEMLAALDPYGAFLTPEEVTEWKAGPPAGEADCGISFVKAHGYLPIVYVGPGSSAEEAGILPGDQIRKIAGREVRGLSLEQARRMLRGEAGATVVLELLRPRQGFKRESIEVAFRRRSFAPFELRVAEGIAVLEVRDVERVDADALAAELDDVRSRGVDRLLVDVRNVTGGGPRRTIPVDGLFVSGPLLRLWDRSGKIVETLEGDRPDVAWTDRVAVLVNGGTAGSGEAIASLLRSERQAKIYGESTFGLGVEPGLFELADGSGLLLSCGLWKTASGRAWNGEGLAPDLVIHGEGRGDEVSADQLRQALRALADEPSGEVRPQKAA